MPRRKMSARIADFVGKLDPGDTAEFFYAGHRVEIDGEHCLLSTDINAPEDGGSDDFSVDLARRALAAMATEVPAPEPVTTQPLPQTAAAPAPATP